jgi:hypothetical protein
MTAQNIFLHASGGDLTQVVKSTAATIITCSEHQRFVSLAECIQTNSFLGALI